ncbi:hypothetical protein BFF78_19795 [Streptomyces fodineus]|uniref:Uncharacterized protein n=1 Tax=Streptomyces fodineus TaxID=1904616 RepID=A0A1D7YBK5_9ACTN|nr:hypothetical protein [Streptomyces fodineus]AOR33005.1 hypothetical protein BFF78_19795 [Streptomyces fodineus]
MLAVAVTMSLVLAGTAGLVYWRVQTALDQQLHDDLAAYGHSLDRALHAGTALPPGPSGSLYQVLDAHGRVLGSSDTVDHRSLLTPAELDSAVRGRRVHRDVGPPAADHPGHPAPPGRARHGRRSNARGRRRRTPRAP